MNKNNIIILLITGVLLISVFYGKSYIQSTKTEVKSNLCGKTGIPENIEDFGYTAEGRMILRKLGVQNWERAECLTEIFNRLKTREEKYNLFAELVEKQIITKDVSKQITILVDDDREQLDKENNAK